MAITPHDQKPALRDQGWYRSMRDTEPVWRDPETGAWNVFRYADVRTAGIEINGVRELYLLT